MPPEPFVVPRFAAEPSQEHLPSGRWADTLRAELLGAAQDLGEIGEPGDVVWFPDRTWSGRTFVPATSRTSTGLELFGYVSYVAGEEAAAFHTVADVTEEVSDAHPEWKVDLCDEIVGQWRGPGAKVAQMTLVWGVPLAPGGVVATAELGGRVRVTVDQCELIENRFTLVAPDDFGGDTLEVRVYDDRGREVAVESLYEEE